MFSILSKGNIHVFEGGVGVWNNKFPKLDRYFNEKIKTKMSFFLKCGILCEDF